MIAVSENIKILLLIALKSEARPLIRGLNLSQQTKPCNRFYKNEDVGLLITGIGDEIVERDIFNIVNYINPIALLNIGICGCTDKSYEIGTLFYVNKLSYNKTKEDFYPDTVVKTALPNCCIITYETEQMDNAKHLNNDRNYLVDMESAIIFKLFSEKFGPHNLQFLKVISDHLSEKEFHCVTVEKLIESSLHDIKEFINTYNSFVKLQSYLPKLFYDFIESICRNLKLTSTQRIKLYRLAKSKYLQKSTMIDDLNSLTQLKSVNKKERSILFKHICNEILQ